MKCWVNGRNEIKNVIQSAAVTSHDFLCGFMMIEVESAKDMEKGIKFSGVGSVRPHLLEMLYGLWCYNN